MESILNLLNVGQPEQWAKVARGALNTLVILVIAWALMLLSRRLIQTFREFMSARAETPEHGKRIETLSRVFRHLSTVVITLVAGMLVLSEAGISIAPILGAAGVVGLAVGFGAQSLIKDYFTGVFLLIEDQLRVGDVVDAGGKSGAIEEMTLRYLRLRDFGGSVHFVPNGLITTVTNHSREFAFAVVDIGVAYSEDTDAAFEVMRDVGQQMRASEAFGTKIIADFETIGVERLADSAVILRGRIKVRALEQWSVRREYLRRIKQAFDASGIEIPFPHMTVYAGQDKMGQAPAHRVLSVASGE